jgi:hypothetical protein
MENIITVSETLEYIPLKGYISTFVKIDRLKNEIISTSYHFKKFMFDNENLIFKDDTEKTGYQKLLEYLNTIPEPKTI